MAMQAQKKLKTECAETNEIVKQGEGSSVVCNQLEFIPDYTIIEWTPSTLPKNLTIIVELPSGVRTDKLIYGVVDNGDTFEIVMEKAKELMTAKGVFKRWTTALTKE